MISHIELSEQLFQQSGEGKLQWSSLDCKSFSVKDITESFTKEQYVGNGVCLQELSGNSILLKKKIKERHDGDMSMLQFLFEEHAIVYNLQPEKRFEVALIDKIETFGDPVLFSMTGFEVKLKT